MKYKRALYRSQLTLLKPLAAKCPLSVVRRTQDSVGRLMSNSYKDQVDCKPVKVGDINCAMLTPKDECSSGVVLYIHGGGYTCGNLDYAKGFGSMLATKCGIRVFVVAYRLAPEYPYPAALDDVMEAYGYLLSSGYDPSRIILCGESAGGGLCYALCQKLRDKGRTRPAGIIAISPWVDLTLSGESYEINQREDPSLTVERLKYFADCYVYGAVTEKGKFYPKSNQDQSDDCRVKREPRISPLFDSKEKMPESLIFVGDDEIMYDDAVMMHRGLVDAGCKSEIVIAPELWHGYILYDLPERESDFYKISKFIKRIVPARKNPVWMALDNAAKIFPASRSRTWSNIFRVSSTLEEDIDREALRVALEVTVRRFPSIAVAIKEGFFWYYHEEIRELPEILDEKPYPLSRMTMKDLRKCAFRVLVYKNRFAVEFFHSLTDGNGGLIFVKTLTAEYLYQKYGIRVPAGNGILDRLEEPSEGELEDSFLKYAGDYPASRKDTDAFRIAGKREADGFRTNTTFVIDPDFVKDEAKKRGVTVTVYLTAVLMEATRRIQEVRVSNPAKYKPIKIFIPVNLRKMFPSETLRNFILYTTPGIDPRLGDYSFDEMCQIIAGQMKLQMTKKNMAAIMCANVSSERNIFIKLVPLFLKNIIMKMVFNSVGEKKTCFSFSNLGYVKVPEEYTAMVRRMDFVLGSQAAAPYNVSALTYGGKMYLNITRNSVEPVLEREVYAVLRERGVPHTVESNTRGKERK
ncbi:MAG: alpha/beta hydrolase [Clostridia bacterium]|nr:alpha/beta hydrolase [Clostridia bacterium]